MKTKTRAECLNAEYMGGMCEASSVLVVKTVRMNLAVVRDFLEDITIGKDLQVVFLYRDPRSVMHSRWNAPWCDIQIATMLLFTAKTCKRTTMLT